MAGLSIKRGQGFGELEAEIRLLQKVVRDPRPTLNQVVYPYLTDHAEEMVQSAGRHGGQSWSLAPRYKAYKQAILGPELAARPLAWARATARLVPSLTDPGHPDAIFRLEQDKLVIGSRVPYAERLLVTGGIGPFGERYPARNPYHLTPPQQQELGDAITYDLKRRLKRYYRTPRLL